MEINHRDIDRIDAILYINLEHRPDRKEHVLNEISKICTVQEKIHRIDAVKYKEGAIGCALSHIKALTFALNNENWNNILIIEDDFTFRFNTFRENKEFINELFDYYNFDVGLLSYNTKQSLFVLYTNNLRIVRVKSSLTASGYIIKKHYILEVLQIFAESLADMLKNGIKDNNRIDVLWFQLQEKDMWFSTNPSIGYQYDNYSDIEKCEVKYDC